METPLYGAYRVTPKLPLTGGREQAASNDDEVSGAFKYFQKVRDKKQKQYSIGN
jgi:hypothetical protein